MQVNLHIWYKLLIKIDFRWFMNRILIPTFLGVVSLTGAFFLLTLKNSNDIHSENYCAFCNQGVLDRQKFYEDDLVLGLYTHKPILPGHCLIIPKRHVERFEDLTTAEISQMGQVIKKVHQVIPQIFETSAYLLLQKNGLEVGQTVPHVHFHYIPRKTGEDSVLKFLWQTYIANIQQPISTVEMQNVVERIKKAFEDSPPHVMP
jgi:histidine triad (HIT) family protein